MKRPAWARPSRRGTVAIEFFTATVTAAVVLAGVFHHVLDNGGAERTYPGEGRRIVAFRQVANRICEENNTNMSRARREATSRTQLLSYMRRAIGWDLHDLTTITPPPKMISEFLDEVALRRHLGHDLAHLQAAAAAGNAGAEARIATDLRTAEAESAEHSGTLGLPRCARVLLPPRALLSHR